MRTNTQLLNTYSRPHVHADVNALTHTHCMLRWKRVVWSMNSTEKRFHYNGHHFEISGDGFVFIWMILAVALQQMLRFCTLYTVPNETFTFNSGTALASVWYGVCEVHIASYCRLQFGMCCVFVCGCHTLSVFRSLTFYLHNVCLFHFVLQRQDVEFFCSNLWAEWEGESEKESDGTMWIWIETQPFIAHFWYPRAHTYSHLFE